MKENNEYSDNYKTELVSIDPRILENPDFKRSHLGSDEDARLIQRAAVGDEVHGAPVKLERPPTAGELLEEGDVRENLHDLPTPTYDARWFDVDQDAIHAERKLQAELQRIADERANERAQMPSWSDAARRVSIAQQNKFIKATQQIMRVGLGNGGTEGKHFLAPDGAATYDPMPMPADMADVAVVKLGRRHAAKKVRKAAL